MFFFHIELFNSIIQKAGLFNLQCTKATNKYFFNSFYPIVPTLAVVGIIAQIVSGTTEAIMVYKAVYNEFNTLPSWLTIIASIVSMCLVVAVLELGGRKFVKVLSRLTVWKKEKSKWFYIMFSIVTIITSVIIFLSFWLSTSTIQNTFTNTHIETIVNDTKIKKDLNDTKAIAATKATTAKETVQTTFYGMETATKAKYKALINEAKAEQTRHETNQRNGLKWAASHITKWKTKVSKLKSEQAEQLAILTTSHVANIEQIQDQEQRAITTATTIYNSKYKNLETVHKNNETKAKNKANLYGSLFMYLVGFCVVLAYVCIATVEVFKKGSEIKTEFSEEEARPFLLPILWDALSNRWYNFWNDKIMNFVNTTNCRNLPQPNTIGFRTNNINSSFQNQTITNENNNHGITNNKDNTQNEIESFKPSKSENNTMLPLELQDLKKRYDKARVSRNSYRSKLKHKQGKDQDHNRNKITQFENLMATLQDEIRSYKA